LIDYVNNGGTRSYYSNYTVYANKSGYINGTNIHNVTVSHNIIDDAFTLSYMDIIFPQISFTSPTPPNDTTTSNTSIEINVSIIEENLDEIKFNWNGTNYTIFNDSVVLFMNFDNRSALGENNTRVVDISGNGNNGTWNGDASPDSDSGPTPSGKHHGAFMFDGNGDYVKTASTTGYSSSQGSFAFWVKRDSAWSDSNSETLIATPTEASVNESGLVGYWRFNNDSSVG
jgi:hypothetical protein